MPVRDTPWPPGTPCWIDLMTTDQPAGRDFYQNLFGWQMQVGGPEVGEYGLASLGGRQVAGIGGMMGMDRPPVWNTYLATADAEATSKAVEAAGGTVVAPVTDVMEFGRMAFAQLPSGGVFGYWQAGTHIGTELVNEPGALTWNEFLTRDYAGAKDFYAAVFGYTYTEIGDETFRYSTIELDGRTVGGIGELPADVPQEVPPHWAVYFAVDDCDAAVGKAVELGATVTRPAADMPYGRHAGLADPQGARFSVIR